MPQKQFLQNKKILIVIAPNNFRDEEYIEPKRILEKQGAEINVASLGVGDSTGAGGMRVKIDTAVSDVNPQDFTAVIFVGGSGMVELINHNKFTALARQFYQAEKLTTAICVAPAILANAGILLNKKATAWPGASQTLKDKGAIYTGQPVEIDGKIITANGPQAAEAFGQAILQSLSK